jgi:methionine-rich copper-binding protein CopC
MRWFTHLQRLWLAALFAITGALGMSVWLAGVASAHASYVSSDPAAGAVLATAPTQVTVHFAENVNPLGANGIPSSLTVFLNPDLKNTNYSDQDATQVSPDKGTQYPVSDTKTMTIPMTGAGNGIYEVYWFTVSADDGHQDSGVFFFGVGTSTGQGVVVVTNTVTKAVPAGLPLWATILIGVVALVLGGGIVAGVRRRPQAAGAGQGNTEAPTSPPEDTPVTKS